MKSTFQVELAALATGTPLICCRSRHAQAAKSSPRASEVTAAASSFRQEHQHEVVNRLRRIEGQLRGLVEMIESGRPCEDVAQQMSAARRAMDRAFYRMVACSILEGVNHSRSEAAAVLEIQRATRILEKYA